MLVKHVTVRNFGPVIGELTIPLDRRITVLTGANDVGKSSILRAFEILLGNAPVREMDVNRSHSEVSGTPWTKDTAVQIEAHLDLNSRNDLSPGQRVSEGDTAILLKQVAPDIAKTTCTTNTAEYGRGRHDIGIHLPAVIRPRLDAVIGDEINLAQPKPLEQAFLSFGFGGPFSFEKFRAMGPLPFKQSVEKANTRLNQALDRVLPPAGSIRFQLSDSIDGDRKRLGIFISDQHDGLTPISNRGAGLQRMVSILAEIVTTTPNAPHRIVLLDEPENSLHADAQHLLREYLWTLTANGRTQVVLATHSSAFINPSRQDQIRLLQRQRTEQGPTSALVPNPESKNFLSVRTSLGISLADSLVYAPAVVVVEGNTEAKCLHPLLRKLVETKDPQFQQIDKLLGLTTFVDGCGESFEYLARVCRAHGTKVVFFLDGDKRTEWEDKLRSAYPDAPLVFTHDQPGEFEQLIPKAVYLRAALEDAGLDFDDDTVGEFDRWILEHERVRAKAFTKQVDIWLIATRDETISSKPRVMLKAIEVVQPIQIEKGPLLSLLKAIESVLPGFG